LNNLLARDDSFRPGSEATLGFGPSSC